MGIAKVLKYKVPGAGIEPAQGEPRGILSPLRLPIPPPRHVYKSSSYIGVPVEGFFLVSILVSIRSVFKVFNSSSVTVLYLKYSETVLWPVAFIILIGS